MEKKEVYAMKLLEGIRAGKRPDVFYEHTYHKGKIPVKNGLVILDDWRVKNYFRSIGYEEVDINLVCTDCYLVFDSKKELEKHLKEVHGKKEEKVKKEKVEEEKVGGKSGDAGGVEEALKNIFK